MVTKWLLLIPVKVKHLLLIVIIVFAIAILYRFKMKPDEVNDPTPENVTKEIKIEGKGAFNNYVDKVRGGRGSKNVCFCTRYELSYIQKMWAPNEL